MGYEAAANPRKSDLSCEAVRYILGRMPLDKCHIPLPITSQYATTLAEELVREGYCNGSMVEASHIVQFVNHTRRERLSLYDLVDDLLPILNRSRNGSTNGVHSH